MFRDKMIYTIASMLRFMNTTCVKQHKTTTCHENYKEWRQEYFKKRCSFMSSHVKKEFISGNSLIKKRIVST